MIVSKRIWTDQDMAIAYWSGVEEREDRLRITPLSADLWLEHYKHDVDVHVNHCHKGEYEGSCKYGEGDRCPALINRSIPIDRRDELAISDEYYECERKFMENSKVILPSVDRKLFTRGRFSFMSGWMAAMRFILKK